jgi:hypothetical protein
MTAALNECKNDKNSNKDSSRSCYFCKDPLEDNKVTSDITCPDWNNTIHRNCHIYFKKIWNWESEECPMCQNERFRDSPCYLWKEYGDLKIPVKVWNLQDKENIQADSDIPASKSGRFQMDYYCYMSYAASFYHMNPTKLEVDDRFVSYFNKYDHFECDLCGNLLRTKDVLNNKYFIKSVTSKEENGRISDVVVVECRDWIDKYFEEWVNQVYNLQSHYQTGKPVTKNSMRFTIQIPMISNSDVAGRRQHFHCPENIKSIVPECSRVKKRILKNFSKLQDNETDNYSNDDEGSNQESEQVEYRPDGRPKRKTKRTLHHDEKYPPEDDSLKRKRLPRSNSKQDMVVCLPTILRKSSHRRKKILKDQAELDSEDEDYIMANRKVTDNKGYSAGSYLIRKYVNKIKYCFDKYRVLSAEHYMEDINITKSQLERLNVYSQSNRFWFINYNQETDKLNLVVNRVGPLYW